MPDVVLDQIAQFMTINATERAAFSAICRPRTLRKKELLLREGDVCRFAAFVRTGCLRYFYSVEGAEHTGQFFFENSWYTDYASFLTGEPTRQSIQALEPTELFLLHRDDLEALYRTHPTFERFGRVMAERAFLGVRHRTEFLTNLSAEERYRQLLRERPKVLERVPQHYIASYLGVKPESLSRIRKRLLGGG